MREHFSRHQLVSRSRRIRSLRTTAVCALVVTILASCAVGRPSGFTARSNAICADASAAITKLSAASDPSAALRYALDRYVIVEKVVATLTDSPLPDGQTGRELRDRWLEPARTSLKLSSPSQPSSRSTSSPRRPLPSSNVRSKWLVIYRLPSATSGQR